MIGDWLQWWAVEIKQTFCWHDYKFNGIVPAGRSKWQSYKCTKCGRVKIK